MQTDRYTKVILTIIAFCLSLNILKEVNIIPNAKANDVSVESTPVTHDGTERPASEAMKFTISNINGCKVFGSTLKLEVEQE